MAAVGRFRACSRSTLNDLGQRAVRMRQPDQAQGTSRRPRVISTVDTQGRLGHQPRRSRGVGVRHPRKTGGDSLVTRDGPPFLPICLLAGSGLGVRGVGHIREPCDGARPSLKRQRSLPQRPQGNNASMICAVRWLLIPPARSSSVHTRSRLPEAGYSRTPWSAYHLRFAAQRSAYTESFSIPRCSQ